ncbi:MAG: DegT/DnrJ/EryC1/StrS family aminotransferase [Planctomycetaceae bacterium]
MSTDQVLHVGRPNIGDRDALLARINDLLDRRWLSNNGPLVQEFEAKIAGILDVKYAIAMCNATVALEIASRAIELQGEVILPSYTFVATAHALQWQGITPVFCDVDPQTHNIDPRCIERLITPKTTGIVGVHVWGRPCDTGAIEQIARQRGLKVMYDSSHAFGCSSGGKMIGGFGECEVFSFHATKFVNCFEGGVVTTNDSQLAEKMRLMRNFGFEAFDRVVYLGVNGKMSEISAAMGLTNLESMQQFVDINRRNYLQYRKGLTGLRGISLIHYDDAERNNFQYVVIEVDRSLCGRTRDEIVAHLHSRNIIARKYFWPGCHKMQPYRSLQPNADLLLPETIRVAERVIVLPTGQAVDLETVSRVCSEIRDSLESPL